MKDYLMKLLCNFYYLIDRLSNLWYNIKKSIKGGNNNAICIFNLYSNNRDDLWGDLFTYFKFF